jgi:hypothetical protein
MRPNQNDIRSGLIAQKRSRPNRIRRIYFFRHGGARDSGLVFLFAPSDLRRGAGMQFLKQDVRSRAVFTVARHLDGWAVEHEGAFLDPCRTQDEARAAANRRARACLDAGRPCQVNVNGETGFFTARGRGADGGRR